MLVYGAGVGSRTSDFRSPSRQKNWRLRSATLAVITDTYLCFKISSLIFSSFWSKWSLVQTYFRILSENVLCEVCQVCVFTVGLPFLSWAEATLKFRLRFHFPLQTGRLRLCNSMVVLLCLLIQFYCRCGTPGVRTRTPRCRSSSPLWAPWRSRLDTNWVTNIGQVTSERTNSSRIMHMSKSRVFASVSDTFMFHLDPPLYLDMKSTFC